MSRKEKTRLNFGQLLIRIINPKKTGKSGSQAVLPRSIPNRLYSD